MGKDAMGKDTVELDEHPVERHQKKPIAFDAGAPRPDIASAELSWICLT